MKKGDEFMADIKENTVSAENQLKREDSVFGKKGNGQKNTVFGQFNYPPRTQCVAWVA